MYVPYIVDATGQCTLNTVYYYTEYIQQVDMTIYIDKIYKEMYVCLKVTRSKKQPNKFVKRHITS